MQKVSGYGYLKKNMRVENMNEEVEYVNGSCKECGCYWKVNPEVQQVIDCECRCHDE